VSVVVDTEIRSMFIPSSFLNRVLREEKEEEQEAMLGPDHRSPRIR
jgi:hypothetical protein